MILDKLSYFTNLDFLVPPTWVIRTWLKCRNLDFPQISRETPFSLPIRRGFRTWGKNPKVPGILGFPWHILLDFLTSVFTHECPLKRDEHFKNSKQASNPLWQIMFQESKLWVFCCWLVSKWTFPDLFFLVYSKFFIFETSSHWSI